jgi:ABC-type polysaccharide/polyol phosphate export permease
MEKTAPVEVYVPFKAGLPPLGRYWRTLWHRRSFITEYSRSELHEKHFDTVFGQVWLIINPLLLSGVYFLLIVIIAGNSDKMRYAHLTACLFLFYFVNHSMSGGAKSVIKGGKLILISCANVYFRDIGSFLPYFSRTWLYLSPILYEVASLKPKLKAFEIVNPLFPIMDAWSRAIVHNKVPHLESLLKGSAWALATFFIGTYFFLSRERDFAVRV